MYEALIIARYIINLCYELGRPITNLRLQKLLYFIQGLSYVRNNMPMFDEEMHTWKYGPVVPCVYYEYCGFSSAPIRCFFEEARGQINAEDAALIDEVVALLDDFNDWDLVTLTHVSGGPWEKYYAKGGIIPNEEIRSYFLGL